MRRSPNSRKRRGTLPMTASSPTVRSEASTRSPASPASARCCGSTASRGISRWASRSRGHARQARPCCRRRPRSGAARFGVAANVSTAVGPSGSRRCRIGARRRAAASSSHWAERRVGPVSTDRSIRKSPRCSPRATSGSRRSGPRARGCSKRRNYGQAAELCRHWADLELGNADAWRCLGRALEGLGHHREAVGALRKAKQYDPADTRIDAAINRSQSGIVADFLSRRGS